ncbi:MAG: PD40 domain-containing protein [Acidobacteria bacterium]|nr:PD40 domain-containing protein [Acidobacteriota bacterium]
MAFPTFRSRPQFSILLASLLFLVATPAAAQDWFRTGTGLGVEKPRVAVADFAPRSRSSQPLANIFSTVLRADLEFSGIIEVVSKSMNPLQSPSVPAELRHAEWNAPPADAHLLAYGNLSASGNDLVIEAWLSDARNAQAPPVLGKRYRGEVTDAEIRRFAHQFADEIIARLSGGTPGVASTQIAFVSTRTGSKEIWAMDYDGSNQRPLTSLRTISLTPRWSPDGLRIAFTCYGLAGGVTSAQICLYSMGDPELFMIDATGSNLRRITYSAGVDTSPAWNPRTGQQVAFISDRGGLPNLYLMNADGSNVEKLELPDMGYVVDPAWAPNGQLLAFSWRRPNGNYDLYLMDTASRQIVELTRDAARNERPSWAPDGRHIVFESTRTGTRQIWTMLADGTQARQLTFEGHNESPNWSPK